MTVSPLDCILLGKIWYEWRAVLQLAVLYIFTCVCSEAEESAHRRLPTHFAPGGVG